MSEVTVVNPTELAIRLGVERSRLHFKIKNVPLGDKTMVTFEMFIDGKDLDEKQLAIARQWIAEVANMNIVTAGKC